MSDQESVSNPSGDVGPLEIDQIKLQMFLQEIRDNQSLSLGALGGGAAAVVGAGIWAGVSALSGLQMGFMAIGVGFLVGYAVRVLGRGIDSTFGIVGATLSVFGCVLGNYLTVCIFIAREYDADFFKVLGASDFQQVLTFMKVTFSPIDLLFYFLAVYYGYKYSIHRISEQELSTLLKPS